MYEVRRLSLVNPLVTIQAPANDSATTAYNKVHPIFNEDLILNSPGSISSNGAKGKAEKFIKIKTPFLISTFNLRPIISVSKKHELSCLADKYHLDLICLQEHKISHYEKLLQD